MYRFLMEFLQLFSEFKRDLLVFAKIHKRHYQRGRFFSTFNLHKVLFERKF